MHCIHMACEIITFHSITYMGDLLRDEENSFNVDKWKPGHLVLFDNIKSFHYEFVVF